MDGLVAGQSHQDCCVQRYGVSTRRNGSIGMIFGVSPRYQGDIARKDLLIEPFHTPDEGKAHNGMDGGLAVQTEVRHVLLPFRTSEKETIHSFLTVARAQRKATVVLFVLHPIATVSFIGTLAICAFIEISDIGQRVKRT